MRNNFCHFVLILTTFLFQIPSNAESLVKRMEKAWGHTDPWVLMANEPKELLAGIRSRQALRGSVDLPVFHSKEDFESVSGYIAYVEAHPLTDQVRNSGEVVTMTYHGNGSTAASIISMPKFNMDPHRVKLDPYNSFQMLPGDLATSKEVIVGKSVVKVEFEPLITTGRFDSTWTMEIRRPLKEGSGKDEYIRVVRSQSINTGRVNEVSATTSESLKEVNISVMGLEEPTKTPVIIKGVFKLPEDSSALILEPRINQNGSRLSILTSDGYQTEYKIRPEFKLDSLGDDLTFIQIGKRKKLTPQELKELTTANVRIYPGRNPTTKQASGMTITQGNQRQPGAQ